ncbi:hypothetical protein DBV15_11020 [Temnothorax longispinosus]|uniref:Uncharacterized protein n=1 Tax=Temnothorax longispinosus TaxID=300112 RepID=A0A4S2KMI2_9HYME|nr:hypothetical protein DBV15_11020 [Temnothorax longispinosus]
MASGIINETSATNLGQGAFAPRGGSVPDSSIDLSSILPLKRQTPTEPNIHDLIQNVFRRWFSQHRKAIRRDELYAPSCQRLTRPAPFAVLYIYAPLFTQLAPRRALAKQYRTLPPIHVLEEET